MHLQELAQALHSSFVGEFYGGEEHVRHVLAAADVAQHQPHRKRRRPVRVRYVAEPAGRHLAPIAGMRPAERAEGRARASVRVRALGYAAAAQMAADIKLIHVQQY